MGVSPWMNAKAKCHGRKPEGIYYTISLRKIVKIVQPCT